MTRNVNKWIVMLALITAGAACSKKENVEAAPEATVPAEAGAEEGAAAEAPAADPLQAQKMPEELGEVKVNPEISKRVDALVANCTVRVEHGQAYSCKDNVGRDFTTWLRENKPNDTFASLSEIALNDPDEQRAAAAASMISQAFTLAGDDYKKANINEEVVKRYIKLLDKQKWGPGLATYATHAAMIEGKAPWILYVMENTDNEYVKSKILTSLMTYGRGEVFPRVKEEAEKAKAAKDTKMLVAALNAPRNMYKPSEEEKALFCPWALSYLGHEDPSVADVSGRLMVRCRGEYIDKLLEEGEKRLAAGKFVPPFSQVFREPCFSMMKGVIDEAAQAEQCEKVYAFLEKVANDEKVDSKVRGLALWNIYYQKRDQETYDLLGKYKDHEDEEIKKRVADARESLEKHYLKKDK